MLFEQERLQPPPQVFDIDEPSFCFTETGVANWLHKMAGPFALGSFLRLTGVK